MSQQSNRVNLRLTDLEKADWTKAAGGARKLSEWIRATCNSAALAGRIEVEETRVISLDNVTPPLLVKDAIKRATTVCPRSRHHRSGVYCGACKQVVK